GFEQRNAARLFAYRSDIDHQVARMRAILPDAELAAAAPHPALFTSTTSCPGPGLGTSRCCSSRCSAPMSGARSNTRIACMLASPHEGGRRRRPVMVGERDVARRGD